MCEKHVAEQQCRVCVSALEGAAHIISATLLLHRDLDFGSAGGLCFLLQHRGIMGTLVSHCGARFAKITCRF